MNFYSDFEKFEQISDDWEEPEPRVIILFKNINSLYIIHMKFDLKKCHLRALLCLIINFFECVFCLMSYLLIFINNVNWFGLG